MTSRRTIVFARRPGVAGVVRSALLAEGHDVELFASEADALAAAAADPPDLVLAEIEALEDATVAFAERLRSRPESAHVPVVALAGFLTRPEKSRLLAASFDDVIVKPISPGRVRVVARRLAASPYARTSHGGGRHVIAVDDNPMLLKLMKLHLLHAGFEVSTARDGVEALALARDVMPDGILSDVLMPGLDGFELCRALRSDPRFVDVPVVLVSAHYVQEGDLDLARRAGATALKLRTSDYAEAIEALSAAIRAQEGAPVDPNSKEFERSHRERTLRQLDRQTALNRGLAQLRSLEGVLPTMVASLSRSLQDQIDFPKAIGDALATILEAAGLSRGAVFLAEDRVPLVAHAGFESAEDAERLRSDAALTDVLQRGEVVAIASAADPEQAARLRKAGVASELFVPLVASGQVLGAMYLASDTRRLGHDDWIAFVRAIGIHFGQALCLNQTSRKMSATERTLGRFFELSPVIKVIVDRHHSIARVNRAFERAFGHPSEAVLGMHVLDLVHTDDRGTAAELLETLGPDGVGTCRARCLRGDGTFRLVDWTISRDPESTTYYAVGVDVTERERVAQQLAASEEKYRSLVENVPDLVCTFDETGAILFVTPNVERVTGFTADEVLEGGIALWLSRIDPDHAARVGDRFQKLLATGEPFDLEYRLRKKDGTWIWAHGRARARAGTDGKRVLDALLADVTENKKLETALLKAQRLQAIGQVTGGIAHDFNNMLSVVLVNAESLLATLPAHDPRHADAEEVKDAAERAAGLTRQLLAFGTDHALASRVFDLGSVPVGMSRMLKRFLGEDVTFKLDVAPDTGAVRADFGQIEQVVMNLVINARDAVKRGGTIEIRTSNADVGSELAASHARATPGPHVVIEVRDDGCGMSEETRRRLFEPFYTTKERGRGSGLGLATSLGIVEECGGFMIFESEVGKGTVARVYLPRVAAGEARPAPQARAAKRGSETILLIEDDESVRGAAVRVLKGRGYSVLVAKDGEEAMLVDGAHTGPVDLILSDVVISKTSGPEIVGRIKEHRSSARVLFMSGYTEHDDVRDAIRTQGAAFLQKPFTPESLSRKVREVLGG